MKKNPHWPHAPMHCLSGRGTYIVTAGTYKKEHFFRGPNRLGVLHRGLLAVAHEFGWQLEAWAVFSIRQKTVMTLRAYLECRASSTRKPQNGQNDLDQANGRQVWHNFWETKLTYEKSYLARLNYVHQNPVKHGLVYVANQYPWCSAAWFERIARPAQVKTIYAFKIDRLRVYD